MHAICGDDGMTVKELKELLKDKHVRDDMEIWLHTNSGFYGELEPEFYITTTTDKRLQIVIMPGKKKG